MSFDQDRLRSRPFAQECVARLPRDDYHDSIRIFETASICESEGFQLAVANKRIPGLKEAFCDGRQQTRGRQRFCHDSNACLSSSGFSLSWSTDSHCGSATGAITSTRLRLCQRRRSA